MGNESMQKPPHTEAHGKRYVAYVGRKEFNSILARFAHPDYRQHRPRAHLVSNEIDIGLLQ